MKSQLIPDIVFMEPDPGSRHQAAVFCNGKKAQTDTEVVVGGSRGRSWYDVTHFSLLPPNIVVWN